MMISRPWYASFLKTIRIFPRGVCHYITDCFLLIAGVLQQHPSSHETLIIQLGNMENSQFYEISKIMCFYEDLDVPVI